MLKTVKLLRIGILAGFVLLGLIYASATPLLEKNDEDHHLALVIHLANGGGLPVQRAGEQTTWMQEGSQPPLYYWLAALPARLFDTKDFEAQVQPNASPQYAAFFPGNKNKLLLTPEKFAFAYSGSMLAAFVLRVLGIATGAVTIWFTFLLAMRATGRPWVALLAMGLAAFNPMLLSVSSAVSNDGLVIALSAVAMWLLAECVMDRITLRRSLLLGCVLGLASLTKVSGGLLLPIAGLALSAKVMLDEKRGLFDLRAHRFALVMAGGWLVIAGGWFARNLLLYGELTGTATMVSVAGPRMDAIEFIGEFRGFRMTFLGIFGQVNVPLDGWVYMLWDWFVVAAIIGLLLAWLARRHELTASRRILFAAMGAHIALVMFSIAIWTVQVAASHGRLLFPALPDIATFLAIGAAQWFSLLRLPERAAAWVMLPFAALAIVAPFRNIAPAYQAPLISALPDNATPANLTLAPYVEVIGYRMTPAFVRAGDTVRVAVYLRALQPTQSNFLLSTKMYGRNAALLARFDTYTGGGLLPSSQWQAGQMWADEMEMRVPANAQAPALLRLQFDLFNAYSGEFAQPINAAGDANSPLFDGATQLPPAQPLQPAVATFGNTVSLMRGETSELRAGEPFTLTLKWQPLKPAQRDATIFVHLIDAQGRLIAQSDSPPDAGQFPATRWQRGATFVETRILSVPADAPAGEYRLSIGLYDPQTGERWLASDMQGTALADASYTTVGIPLKR